MMIETASGAEQYVRIWDTQPKPQRDHQIQCADHRPRMVTGANNDPPDVPSCNQALRPLAVPVTVWVGAGLATTAYMASLPMNLGVGIGLAVAILVTLAPLFLYLWAYRHFALNDPDRLGTDVQIIDESN